MTSIQPEVLNLFGMVIQKANYCSCYHWKHLDPNPSLKTCSIFSS